MKENKIPTKSEDVLIDNIFWSFWHSEYVYNINNEYICFMRTEAKVVDSKGIPILSLGSCSGKVVMFGVFTLYKVFLMTKGQYGIDKTRPLKIIDIKSEYGGASSFKQMGIFECYASYINQLH